MHNVKKPIKRLIYNIIKVFLSKLSNNFKSNFIVLIFFKQKQSIANNKYEMIRYIILYKGVLENWLNVILKIVKYGFCNKTFINPKTNVENISAVQLFNQFKPNIFFIKNKMQT